MMIEKVCFIWIPSCQSLTKLAWKLRLIHSIRGYLNLQALARVLWDSGPWFCHTNRPPRTLFSVDTGKLQEAEFIHSAPCTDQPCPRRSPPLHIPRSGSRGRARRLPEAIYGTALLALSPWLPGEPPVVLLHKTHLQARWLAINHLHKIRKIRRMKFKKETDCLESCKCRQSSQEFLLKQCN